MGDCEYKVKVKGTFIILTLILNEMYFLDWSPLCILSSLNQHTWLFLTLPLKEKPTLMVLLVSLSR